MENTGGLDLEADKTEILGEIFDYLNAAKPDSGTISLSLPIYVWTGMALPTVMTPSTPSASPDPQLFSRQVPTY